MSSFGKALKSQRKTHRERAQPESRKRLGLLEKGKDWKQRRDDFHRKERRIKSLTQKARARNPDEFYFGMIKSKTKGGIHQLGRDTSKVFSTDELKLMKTQDAAYVHTRRSQEAKQIGKMKSTMQLLGATDEAGDALNSHTVFVDSAKEAREFDPSEYFDTVPELQDRAFNRPRRSTLKQAAVTGPMSAKQIKHMEKRRSREYQVLEERMSREQAMRKVAGQMEVERALMGKGRRQKVSDATDKAPAVYKWKKERKR